MDLLSTLDAFFTAEAPLERGDRLLVAFSGGVDSTALLWGLARLAPARGAEVFAAHLDHGLDAGSAGRAAAARRLAGRLDVPIALERRTVRRRRRESPEAAARRVRYAFLERRATALGARWIATAHQADDQVETVLLRLCFGSGLAGLAGIAARRGRLVRPLLTCDRRRLARAVAAAGLVPIEDPSNADLRRPRNRIRHHLLPRLEASRSGLGRRMLALARAARGASSAVERALGPRLDLRRRASGIAVPRSSVAALPAPLLPFALALVHRRAGLPYPPSSAVARELGRQLATAGAVGCDCGGGWRWRSRDGELRLERPPTPPRPFAYELEAPGGVELPELGLRLRLGRRPVADWMFRGEPRRAALAPADAAGGRWTVRSRRRGDRVRPLGCGFSRRLKEVLIDRKIERLERDRLPLLCRNGRIVWVPGVTIDDRCRIPPSGTVWVAELEESPAGSPPGTAMR